MSIDKSLVPKGRLKRQRNVLSRDERLDVLEKDKKWQEGQSVYSLPKVRAFVRVRKKAKKEEKPAEAGVEAEAATVAPEGDAAEKKPPAEKKPAGTKKS